MYFGAQLSIKALFPQKTRLLSVNLSHGHAATTVCCAAAGTAAALSTTVVLTVCAAVIKVVRS